MTRNEKRAAMMERIATHGRNLIKAYALPDDTDPMELCRKLRLIEGRMNRAAERACNLPDQDKNLSRAVLTAEGSVLRLLGRVPTGFFVNTDPRGYALKIETEHTPTGIHRDWGGYGILAPDLSEGW